MVEGTAALRLAINMSKAILPVGTPRDARRQRRQGGPDPGPAERPRSTSALPVVLTPKDGDDLSETALPTEHKRLARRPPW